MAFLVVPRSLEKKPCSKMAKTFSVKWRKLAAPELCVLTYNPAAKVYQYDTEEVHKVASPQWSAASTELC
jgi:hypothetical protein